MSLRVPKNNETIMKPVRLTTNIIILLLMPIIGGSILLGYFIYQAIAGKENVREILRGEEFLF